MMEEIYVPAQPRIIHIREYVGPFANGPAQPRIVKWYLVRPSGRPASMLMTTEISGLPAC